MTGTALNVVSFLFLGFFLGMRHATDADHVAAKQNAKNKRSASGDHRATGRPQDPLAWSIHFRYEPTL